RPSRPIHSTTHGGKAHDPPVRLQVHAPRTPHVARRCRPLRARHRITPHHMGARLRRRTQDRIEGKRMALTIYGQLEQGTDEWLEARAGILTASTIGQLITAKTIKPAMNDRSRGLCQTLIAERITC